MRKYGILWRLFAAALAAILFACAPEPLRHIPSTGGQNPEEPEPDEPGFSVGNHLSDLAQGAAKHGLDYVYDMSALPEVHLEVSLSEWNRLLDLFDADSGTKEQIHANVRFVKNGKATIINDIGLRLKGNTSRCRPEGSRGQHHNPASPSWKRVHFQMNFHKFVKDDDHKLHGAKKIYLKFFHGDPSYVREPFCYKEFRDFGVWTASWTSYCRLFVKVEGDAAEAYYGVYDMIEPIDEDFLKVRKAETMFGSSKGNLWKCRYGASLRHSSADFGPDLGDGTEHVYELKTNIDKFAQAKAQLQDFISKCNSLSGEAFRKWMSAHCDVDLLLRTYAVNVVTGMWDDYWNNCNNYYIYINSTSATDYVFYFLPYDYDNTLGTSISCGVQQNAATQDPFNWGDGEHNPLIHKVIQIPEWKELYRFYLLQAVAERDGLSWQDRSMKCIRDWQRMISPYIANDTGEGNAILDSPASWSAHGYYRLLDPTPFNYFKVKTSSILQYCGE